jgi:acyl-coenzyme A synthetase/AMP-(fatty) acid ligase
MGKLNHRCVPEFPFNFSEDLTVPEVDPGDNCVIFWSSGTTGAPKEQSLRIVIISNISP